MEQPRTNTATYVIPVESEVIPNAPESKPNPESLEFATKIPLKLDPLVVADNSQHAALESDSVMKKICVFLFVLIICSFYNALGFLDIYMFISWSNLYICAACLGVIISELFVWPFAISNLSGEEYSLFFNFILYSGLVGLLFPLIRWIRKIKSAENAIQEQDNLLVIWCISCMNKF